MSNRLVVITYREYTTEGRFINAPHFVSIEEQVRNDIEAFSDPDLTPLVETQYQESGRISQDERLKDVWPTNVTVRDPRTGRFMKWKY